jgi:acetolactate synthase-1/2/3 large subunit
MAGGPVSAISCATELARTLHGLGVRHVFGHPGGEVVDLIEALERNGVRFVLTGHESAAAFMAGAIGRLTGTPGVCLSTVGPGACNLLLGVASAYLDRDPLLAFSARATAAQDGRSEKQNLPLNALFAHVTKQSIALDGAGTAEQVEAATRLAVAPPRGPVFLSLPADVAVGPARPLDAPVPAPACGRAATDVDLDRFAGALSRLRRPVAVLGVALEPRRDAAAVRRFLAATGMPYVALPQAKGIADERGASYLGTVASAAADAPVIAALRQSDGLLGIGFDPVESAQDWHYDRPVYSIASAPIGFRDFRPALECVGDVSALLDALTPRYRGVTEWSAATLAEIRASVARALQPSAERRPAGLAPYHVLRVLREIAPEPTIMATDVGAHKMAISQLWRTPEPLGFLVSNGLSAMGYGVPAALAAALVRPERPVVALVGDGGFAMMVQELETARRLGVAPLILVFQDRSLAVIKVAQQTRGIPHRGVDFAPVDWAAVARGFGAHGVTVDELGELDKAIRDWLAEPRLTVLAVSVDETLYTGLTY